MRQIMIGALIVLMLKFRPQGIFPDRHGIPRARGASARQGRLAPAAAAGGGPSEGAPRAGRALVSAAAILEVKALTKTFGGVTAVDECSFTVREGTVVGLIGPNGAGKSTTIDLVSGFGRADSGSVRFDGAEVVNKAPHRISRLGLIRTFQAPREWGTLTVQDNVVLGMRAFARESILRNLFAPRSVRRAEQADRLRAEEILEQFQPRRRALRPSRDAERRAEAAWSSSPASPPPSRAW